MEQIPNVIDIPWLSGKARFVFYQIFVENKTQKDDMYMFSLKHWYLSRLRKCSRNCTKSTSKMKEGTKGNNDDDG